MPLTKEEIISNELGIEYHSMTSDQLSVFHRCMDEYAKQQSISFSDWLYKNYTQCDITDKWVECAKPLSKNSKTSQQLYNQFIEQQNKEQ